MSHPENTNGWILYAPLPKELDQPPPPLAPWIASLAAGPVASFGELEDGALVEGVVPIGWRCTVLPEYILPHSCVACVEAPSGQYVMLFFHKVGARLHQQERPAREGLLGWFQVQLAEPITDAPTLIKNLRHAVSLLAKTWPQTP
jgi:hypothetical protein